MYFHFRIHTISVFPSDEEHIAVYTNSTGKISTYLFLTYDMYLVSTDFYTIFLMLRFSLAVYFSLNFHAKVFIFIFMFDPNFYFVFFLFCFCFVSCFLFFYTFLFISSPIHFFPSASVTQTLCIFHYFSSIFNKYR